MNRPSRLARSSREDASLHIAFFTHHHQIQIKQTHHIAMTTHKQNVSVLAYRKENARKGINHTKTRYAI